RPRAAGRGGGGREAPRTRRGVRVSTIAGGKIGVATALKGTSVARSTSASRSPPVTGGYESSGGGNGVIRRPAGAAGRFSRSGRPSVSAARRDYPHAVHEERARRRIDDARAEDPRSGGSLAQRIQRCRLAREERGRREGADGGDDVAAGEGIVRCLRLYHADPARRVRRGREPDRDPGIADLLGPLFIRGHGA